VKQLTYYLDKGNGQFEPFYQYNLPTVGVDECYARQLCTYFIVRGTQYELISNEMSAEEEILVVKETGRNLQGEKEKNYRGLGIHIEFRNHELRENYRLLSCTPYDSHYDVLRYLLKDVVDVPGTGQMLVTSTEIDEDRGVYVIYVKELDDVDG
jgi:hypothetical protein